MPDRPRAPSGRKNREFAGLIRPRLVVETSRLYDKTSSLPDDAAADDPPIRIAARPLGGERAVGHRGVAVDREPIAHRLLRHQAGRARLDRAAAHDRAITGRLPGRRAAGAL